jgi:hypothetical protein
MSPRLHNHPSAKFDFEVAGLRYTARVSRFPDGRVGEIFSANHNSGSQSGSNARDAAVAANLALQFGCPLDVLRRALLRDAHGSASTPLGAAIEVGLLAAPRPEPEPKQEPRARPRWDWCATVYFCHHHYGWLSESEAGFVKNILNGTLSESLNIGERLRGERR